MVRLLKNCLRRPPVRMGDVQNSRIRVTRTSNAQFVSFLEQSGFRQVNPDRYERSMQRRRLLFNCLFWATVAGFSWVVIESAQALSLF